MVLRSSPHESCFFDDDWSNIQSVRENCKKINAVCVGITEVDWATWLTGLTGNPFAEFITRLQKDGILSREVISTGFTQYDRLIAWAENIPGKKCVFFDWDYTLSMASGVLSVNPQEYGCTFQDMLYYYVGGEERFNRLTAMFTRLRQLDVDLYILTNNPVCGCKYPLINLDAYGEPRLRGLPKMTGADFFGQLLQGLGIPADHLLASGRNTKYNQNKARLLKEKFKLFC